VTRMGSVVSFPQLFSYVHSWCSLGFLHRLENTSAVFSSFLQRGCNIIRWSKRCAQLLRWSRLPSRPCSHLSHLSPPWPHPSRRLLLLLQFPATALLGRRPTCACETLAQPWAWSSVGSWVAAPSLAWTRGSETSCWRGAAGVVADAGFQLRPSWGQSGVVAFTTGLCGTVASAPHLLSSSSPLPLQNLV
jgi:hypothetical protein